MSTLPAPHLLLLAVLIACDVVGFGSGCQDNKKSSATEPAREVAKQDTPAPAPKAAEPEAPPAPAMKSATECAAAAGDSIAALKSAREALDKKDFRAAISRSRRALDAIENCPADAKTGSAEFGSIGSIGMDAEQLHADAKGALENLRSTVAVAIAPAIKNKGPLKPEAIEAVLREALLERVKQGLEARGLKLAERAPDAAQAQALIKGDRPVIQAMEATLGAGHVMVLTLNVDIEKKAKVFAVKLEAVTGTLYETSSGRLVNRDDLGRAMQQSEDASAALKAAVSEHTTRYGNAIDDMFRSFGAGGDTTPKEETPIIEEN